MRITFFSIILITLFSCVSSESINQPDKQVKRYAFGKGGGFTGDYNEFILGEDGKVFKYDFKYNREVYYKDLSKEDLTYFMEKIDKLGLEGIDINHPGNISNYIEVRIGTTSMNKIVWGDHQYYAPKELTDLHQEVYKKLAEFEP
ncbi:MAG: hypothetical protein KDD41_10510 [Flavobacteriales bacterium]|nr:hypothetical protein [Flavobacteriales bacterium]